jgi:hypothetical protein
MTGSVWWVGFQFYPIEAIYAKCTAEPLSMEALVWLCLRLLQSSRPPPRSQARPAVAKQRQGSHPRPAPTERQGGPVAKNSGSFFPPSPRHEAFIGETLSNNRNITLRFSQRFSDFIYHLANGDEMPDSNPIFLESESFDAPPWPRSALRPPLICSPTWEPWPLWVDSGHRSVPRLSWAVPCRPRRELSQSERRRRPKRPRPRAETATSNVLAGCAEPLTVAPQM